MKPPIAERREHSQVHHGVTLEDPYHWLKDPAYPEVKDERILDYLRAENAYFEDRMRPCQALVDELFAELKAREPEAETSVAYREGGYWYRWRFEKDAQYRLWERAPLDAPERWQTFLDEPVLAADHEYFALGGFSVSPDGRYLAWTADSDGSERFQLSIRDLHSTTLQKSSTVDEPISNSLDAPIWAGDSDHLFYLQLNDNWRPHQVRLHKLGTPIADDPVVFEESDESFFVGIDETQSQAFIQILAADHITSEVRLVPTGDPTATPVLVCPRQTGHEYHLDHREGRFYIRSNDQHKNFRLAVTAETEPQQPHWQTLIEGSDAHYLVGHLCFKHWLIVAERVAGLDQIRVVTDLDTDAPSTHSIDFPEASYSVDFGANAEYDQSVLRLGYDSMVTPATVYDYQLTERRLEVRKVQQIPSGFDASDYVTERLMVNARDGVTVPMSLVRRRDLIPGPDTPALLYGYGAYGMAMEPGFASHRLSLLDRGFVYAIAHIRGGDDLGYHWYEDGKLDKRTNTFNDFVDCARHLIDSGYSGRGRLTISGASAGGELMGAVVNQASELFGAVVSHVPFVDVLNTMLDAELPLTPMEWPEWGNPIEDPAAFELIRSYSPYDQLKPGDFPAMLITAGLFDPRVTYWEPAKYVARLRHLKTDSNWLLLKTNMGAGHGGQSGRYDSLREVAEEFAFLLISLGLVDPVD